MGSIDREPMLRVREIQKRFCLHRTTKDHWVLRQHPLQPSRHTGVSFFPWRKKIVLNKSAFSSTPCKHMDHMPSVVFVCLSLAYFDEISIPSSIHFPASVIISFLPVSTMSRNHIFFIHHLLTDLQAGSTSWLCDYYTSRYRCASVSVVCCLKCPPGGTQCCTVGPNSSSVLVMF